MKWFEYISYRETDVNSTEQRHTIQFYSKFRLSFVLLEYWTFKPRKNKNNTDV